MKKFLTVAVILLAVSTLLVTTGCKKDAGTVKIGVAGPHSGDLASFGIPTTKAAELVVAKWNADGGVLGRQIELVIEDDVCDPNVATDTAAKLVGEEVVAIIGHICSGATKSAMGIYLESGIPAVSPSATNPALTQSGDYPNFFRTIAPDDAQGALDAEFIANVLQSKKAAVLHDQQDYGKGFAEFTKNGLDALGVETVLFEGITVGAVDYSSILTKVANSGAEVLVFGGYHPEASKLVQQMKQKGMEIPFVSDDGVKDPTFIKVAGEFAEGVYASGPRDTSSNPLTQEFEALHRETYGEDPGAFFLNGVAATEAVLNAIEAADSTDGEAIMKALRSEYVETTLGSISFDDRGDAIGVGFSVFQVQNGVYVEL